MEGVSSERPPPVIPSKRTILGTATRPVFGPRMAANSAHTSFSDGRRGGADQRHDRLVDGTTSCTISTGDVTLIRIMSDRRSLIVTNSAVACAPSLVSAGATSCAMGVRSPSDVLIDVAHTAHDFLGQRERHRPTGNGRTSAARLRSPVASRRGRVYLTAVLRDFPVATLTPCVV